MLVSGTDGDEIRASVWSEPAELGVVESGRLSEAVIDAASAQIERFISLYSLSCSAQKNGKTEKNSKDAHRRLRPQRKAENQRHVKGSFVASRNSSIFHRVSCSSARRISASNRVYYKTAAQAVKDGKRPCKRCMK